MSHDPESFDFESARFLGTECSLEWGCVSDFDRAATRDRNKLGAGDIWFVPQNQPGVCEDEELVAHLIATLCRFGILGLMGTCIGC